MSPTSSIPYVSHEKYPHSRSAPATGEYEQTQKLEQNYKVLQRKYGNIDKLYKEARQQNQFLKDQLEKKTEQWREWYDWWNVQRQSLRVKSTSPAKNQRERNDEMIAMKDREAQDEAVGRTDVRMKDPEEDDNEEAFFRTTFSPDAVATRRDTQSMVSPQIVTVKPGASNEHIISPQQKVNLPIDNATSEKRKSKSAVKDDKEPHLLPDIKEFDDMQDVQATSKPSEKTEILVIPESPVTYQGRISVPQKARPIPFEPSPRPKSAPIQHSRALNSSTPLPTRSSGQKKKKEREYPSMKHWTEDGTDGINPVHSLVDDDDDGGLLMAMLEGPPPGPPGIASPLPLVNKKPSPSKSEPPVIKNETIAKGGRVRDFIEIESDSESEGVSTPEMKRQKVTKAQSEPRRFCREILSPDLASKNKGRGRYSTSLPKRYCPYYSI
jgi:hypothetical protein